jgi:signal transduction histidine kinase
MNKFISKLVYAQYADPDRERRAETLNIIILVSVLISILTFISMFALEIMNIFDRDETMLIYIPTSILLIVLLLLYFLNRKNPTIAGVVFLLTLVGLLSASDTPEAVASGRGLLHLALPIIIASIVLPPWTSFVFAGIVSLTVNAIGLWVGIRLTPFSTFAYVVIALVSYLGAMQLENALIKLRAINEELDRRVANRTIELRKANQQLADANEQLRELDRLKSRFLSMVSHELRTPLSAIQGFAEMLLAEIYGPLSERQENALDRITTNTSRLLFLVNDLLDQARIEAGQISLQMNPFSPNDLAGEFHSTMNVLAQAKGLTLTTEVDPAMQATIYGDEKRLHQIMVNIANNAIKFTDEGFVKLRIYPDDGHGQEPSWVIECSDTGPGISKEDQTTIFEPFRRVDDSRTREHLGVGLGLAIVKELVELMEGEIDLKSEVGVGSTFMIRLPLSTTGGKHE